MELRYWSGDKSRKIIERVIIEGDLVLETPAHFGNGDTDDLTDMPLLTDSVEPNRPLLTGASIAGALRSYLRQREHGYRQKADSDSSSVVLFGSLKGDEDGEQSPLIVDDALGEPDTFGIEMRDGVGINRESRTAEHDRLFDLQLWRAGTKFLLRFELLVCKKDDDTDHAQKLKCALATALEGFQGGSITLGARKRRGYGKVKVNCWRVKTLDLTSSKGLLDWIEHGSEQLASVSPVADIKTALGVASPLADARKLFQMEATFWLDGSLLIRSGSGQDDQGPDAVHLHSIRADSPRDSVDKPVPLPILSGTSLAGALRARALRIANTIGDGKTAAELINQMFGREMNGDVTPAASKIEVEEQVVAVPPRQQSDANRTRLVQNRVSIDRFTGGARETALFNEQPVFGGEDTRVKVNLKLIDPQCHEIGMLLLLLKDLWTGDLPLGGESSVGRGRLHGISANLMHRFDGNELHWEITPKDSEVRLNIPDNASALEMYVAALHTYLKG